MFACAFKNEIGIRHLHLRLSLCVYITNVFSRALCWSKDRPVLAGCFSGTTPCLPSLLRHSVLSLALLLSLARPPWLSLLNVGKSVPPFLSFHSESTLMGVSVRAVA